MGKLEEIKYRNKNRHTALVNSRKELAEVIKAISKSLGSQKLGDLSQRHDKLKEVIDRLNRDNDPELIISVFMDSLFEEYNKKNKK